MNEITGSAHTVERESAAYTIAGFCRAHGISRTTYYQLKRAGDGPTEMKVRGRVLISHEAARAWRRRMEAESA